MIPSVRLRLTVCAALATLSCSVTWAATPPNVVWIISDDQGWGDYSFMGHPSIQTPRLDRLASESRVFTRGYVAAPLCRPSLSSMITGLPPHIHHITCNDPPKIGGKRGWPPERLALRRRMIANMERATTIPRLLGKLGYISLQTGKWWEGNYRIGGFTHGMTHGDPARGGRHGDAGLKIGRVTLQPVLDFIDQAVSQDKPFFVWYAPMLPHQPHNPPERLLAKYRDKTPSIHIARYWAMCEWFDETCGRLLDYLDRKGLRDNTLVLYICDNGWIQSENQARFAARSKRTSYEGGIRTPVMVRWPGRVPPGRDDKTVVSALDLAPTTLAACGIDRPANMPGVNLLDDAALRARDAVCGATYSHDAVDIDDPAANLQERWIVTSRWKLTLPFRRNDPAGVVQLYDLVADAAEKHNLAGEHPDLVQRLRQRLDAWWLVRPHAD